MVSRVAELRVCRVIWDVNTFVRRSKAQNPNRWESIASLTDVFPSESGNVNDAIRAMLPKNTVRHSFDSRFDPRKDDHNQNGFPHLSKPRLITAACAQTMDLAIISLMSVINDAFPCTQRAPRSRVFYEQKVRIH